MTKRIRKIIFDPCIDLHLHPVNVVSSFPTTKRFIERKQRSTVKRCLSSLFFGFGWALDLILIGIFLDEVLPSSLTAEGMNPQKSTSNFTKLSLDHYSPLFSLALINRKSLMVLFRIFLHENNSRKKSTSTDRLERQCAMYLIPLRFLLTLH